MNTPNYIQALLMPQAKKSTGRRVWSIDLETVWLPFFTATNAEGQTLIPSDALGCPLRLGYNHDGTVKFSQNGKPVIKVVKEIGDSVRMVRENFVAGLQKYANQVIANNAEGYRNQVELADKAGKPIYERDNANLNKAIAEAVEREIAKAEAKQKESELVTA